MLQRIQTLYLFIAWGLFASLFFVEMGTLYTGDGLLFSFNLKGFFEVHDGKREMVNHQWAIFIMSGFIHALFAISIALFRRRVAQLRVCIYLIVFTLGIGGVSLYKLYMTGEAMQTEVVYHLTMWFPVLSSILIWLAFRAIRKDELLVKAYERLRS